MSKKRAISTVLTTVIILVSSVVLGSGVVLYGTSLFQGGTQTESMSVSNVDLWVHSTDSNGFGWGAATVRNTGDKVISIDTIQVRGSDIPFSQWYPDTDVSDSLFSYSLVHPGWDISGNGFLDTTGTTCTGTPTIDIENSAAGEDYCADAASGPISLNSGDAAVIYFQLANGTLSTLDSGINTSVNIFAGSAGAPQSITIEAVK